MISFLLHQKYIFARLIAIFVATINIFCPIRMSGGPGHARLQETLNRVNLWKIGRFAFIRNSRVGLCLNGSLKNCIDPEKYCSAEPQICRIEELIILHCGAPSQLAFRLTWNDRTAFQKGWVQCKNKSEQYFSKHPLKCLTFL